MTNTEIKESLKLRIVVLERPYDIYRTSEFTRNFISEIFKLKLEGYCSKYPYGILPISEYDFMATHVCLAIENESGLIPISAFKSVSSEACTDFKVPFPIIQHKFGMFQKGFEKYIEALKDWQENLDKSKHSYAYNASWTMKTELPKEVRELTREISIAMFYFYYSSAKIDHVINSTAATFNVNKHQEMMGLKYLKDRQGDDLPVFKCPVFFDEPFYIMYLDSDGFSEVFAKRCESFKALWDNRIIINQNNLDIKKVA